MKKFGKTMMGVMGATMIGGMIYYVAMPKDKKKEVCNKFRKMIKTDEDFMEEFY